MDTMFAELPHDANSPATPRVATTWLSPQLPWGEDMNKPEKMAWVGTA
ncbi:hypothetical protein [Steroidobacter denitrificans]|nr:hypothetical protein [Steroidobacter denitrificans]